LPSRWSEGKPHWFTARIGVTMEQFDKFSSEYVTVFWLDDSLSVVVPRRS